VDIPDLLTVEEAARLARIGRTKAYAMAREWRETGGESGLPVVDFGHVLRVPRRALEALIGAELTAFPDTTGEAAPSTPIAKAHEPAESQPELQTPPSQAKPQTRATSRTRRHHTDPSTQLDLFTPTSPTP
jgi:Helix-turn-helix domain